MTTRTTGDRAPMRLERTVAAVNACVAAQLTRDGGWGATQSIGDFADAKAGMTQVGDLDPLVLRQKTRADRSHGQPFQRLRRNQPSDRAGTSYSRGPSSSPSCGKPRPPLRRQGCSTPLPQLHEPLTLSRLRTTTRGLLHTPRRQNDSNDLGVLRRSLETTRHDEATQFCHGHYCECPISGGAPRGAITSSGCETIPSLVTSAPTVRRLTSD